MMLRGAIKVQTEKTAQIQPTIEILNGPFEKRNVPIMIKPYAPTLNNKRSFVVYI